MHGAGAVNRLVQASQPYELLLPLADRAIGVSCAASHSVVLGASGAVYTVGSNTRGELGLGHCQPVVALQRVPVNLLPLKVTHSKVTHSTATHSTVTHSTATHSTAAPDTPACTAICVTNSAGGSVFAAARAGGCGLSRCRLLGGRPHPHPAS